MKLISLFVTLATLATTTLPAMAERQCIQQSCIVDTFYANVSKDRVVGTWSSCPGMKGLKASHYTQLQISSTSQ